MKNIFFYLLILILFSFKHPFFLSVCDLKYNEKEKVIQGSVKIFINDFENALNKQAKKKIDLFHPKDSLALKQEIEKYLVNHLKIKVNDSNITFKIIGFETEEEAFWSYIESSSCASPKSIHLENTLLYEVLKDQINIVHMDVKGQKQSLKCSNPEKSLDFKF